MQFLSLLIICILYSYSLFILYIAIMAKDNGDIGAFTNNIANFAVLVISVSVNLIIVNNSELSNIDFLVFPFDYLTISFLILFFPLFLIFIYNEKRKVNRGNGLPKFEESFSTRNILPFKYDLYRKLTHLVVLFVVLFYFNFGFWTKHVFIYLSELLPEDLYMLFYSIFLSESNNMIFTQYLVVFLVGISLFGLLTADFFRILKPKLYPLKSVNKILREKELHLRLGPQISMTIGCFSIIILYGLFQPLGPMMICTAMIISIFGDMASNLIGRVFGKKKIRNTQKTYAGLYSGIVVGFLSGIIFLLIINAQELFGYLGIFILTFIGSMIIGLLDYLDLEIDDNLTYPFIVSSILFFLSLFF
ncbi:MAG: Cytidylyltransferase family protein [Promethearchaeota archaeon]|nr:MAG: Cytidylyltransferase family protein [Candidatus Lokiarchaeota archaeon]